MSRSCYILDASVFAAKVNSVALTQQDIGYSDCNSQGRIFYYEHDLNVMHLSHAVSLHSGFVQGLAHVSVARQER